MTRRWLPCTRRSFRWCRHDRGKFGCAVIAEAPAIEEAVNEIDSVGAHSGWRCRRTPQGEKQVGRFSVAAGFGVRRNRLGGALDAPRYRSRAEFVLCR